MKYKMGNLVFQIEDLPIYSLQQYELFRNDGLSQSDCSIKIEYTDELVIPDQECLYQFEEGVYVFTEEKKEYRYFIDYYTKQITSVLIDDGNQKILKFYNPNARFPISEMVLFNSLGLEKTLSEYGRFILHSSFIETEHGAVLFTAPSQTGKSTQANLWNKYKGAEIINGDRSCVWKDESGKYMAGGIPWCGTSGITKNKTMPLLAIIILKQGNDNIVNELPFITKAGRLIEQTTINPWNNDMYTSAQNFWMDLCMEVPVLELSCRPDEDAVNTLSKELEKYVK